MKVYSLPLTLVLCAGAISNFALADDITDLLSKVDASGSIPSNEASALIDTFRKYAAQESASAGKIVDYMNNGATQKQPKHKNLKDIPLAHKGKKRCKDKGSEKSGKCASSLFENLEKKHLAKSHPNTQLLIFVSQSVPANSIKELWEQAQRVGGKLVFRGLVGASFKQTHHYIQELGIVADIDPTKFDEFEVTQVPTFVLSKESNYDKMVGNISLVEFLEQSSSNGDLKTEAAEYYKMFKGGNL